MPSNFHFAKTPEIYFGAGKSGLIGKLIKKFGSSVLLISGSESLKQSGKWEEIMQQLTKEKLQYIHISLKGEPSPTFVDTVCQSYKGKGINAILAIGGGSVVDVGKAISAMLTQKNSVFNYLEGVGDKIHNGVKIPFIAVPTTSGTGSETTKNAVLSQVGLNGFKKSIRHDNFVPDIAIIDPELTISLPSHITAACGMDAFTQLLESFVSTKASPMTDSLAYEAMRSIREALLPVCTTHPDNIKFRSYMAYASMISGITLANAGLGIVHGFASAIGGFFNIPHGVVCGTLMGAATRKNIELLAKNDKNSEAFKKYARIGKMMVHGCEKDDFLYASKLVDLIDDWTKRLAIPKLGAYGIQESDLEKIIAITGQKNNPVKLEKQDLLKILIECL